MLRLIRPPAQARLSRFPHELSIDPVLAIVLPRATSAQGPADVAAAMAQLAPELASQPHVEAIEFYVPGPKGRAPLRYNRAADGTYTLQAAPQ